VTKIGEAKETLSAAIRDEFGEFQDRLKELSTLSSELSIDAGGINGLSGFWRSLGQQLDLLANTVSERETGVLAALAGKSKHEIRFSVDDEHSERVTAARRELEADDVGADAGEAEPAREGVAA
jgi:hypothetical protein